jgi:putative peptidoglycan lipid II flippase
MTVESAPGEGTAPASPLETASEQAPRETARIARSASIISLGNVASRVLGLARETAKSHYFGAGGAVDAFTIATLVPTMLYDLLVGGLINSSLVPVFSEYAAEKRDELWRLVSVILSLAVVVMAAFTLVVEVFSRQVAFLLSPSATPEVLDLSARLLRITVPAVLFLSLSGVLSGLLYALKRFAYPAFTAAVFNAGIVVLVLLFHAQWGVASMAVGLLVGAILQVILQLPGLRDARLVFTLSLRHSGLRRVALLYLPIALGLIVDIVISRTFSYNIASRTGEGGISWMSYATYLRQLPQGLVALAVSFAVLPTLSAQAAHERASGPDASREPFVSTLAQGIRLVTVLMVPATVGLFILAHPTVALLYEHGDFLSFDTRMTSLALQFYLLGLPFAAVDLLLVFAFYARQDTLTPSLIGVGTILVYLIVTVALLPVLGLFSLMAADSLKLLLHMVVSWWILRRRLDGMARHGVMRAVGWTLVASSIMGLATYGALAGVEAYFPAGGGLAEVLSVALPAALGGGVYLVLITLFRVEEIHLLWSALRRRLGS